MQATDMYIRMEGMKFYAFHGVMPQENVVGSYFYIDLKLKIDFTQAAETDELEGTVSYADIYTTVKEEMETPSKLLEHVCQRIAQRIFTDFPTIESIDIRLSKENPPMGACGRRKEGGLERIWVPPAWNLRVSDSLCRFQPKGEGAFPGDAFKGHA